MRRNAFSWIELVVVLAIIGILAAILLPVFNRGNSGEGRQGACRSNLKMVTLGVKQYVQDYDEKYPPVAVVRSGYWAGSLQPYLKSWQIFQCSSAKNHAQKTTDYFYNARLAQVAEGQLNFFSQTILLGDGSDDSRLNYALSQLPQSWISDPKSPAKRHLDGANYAFADGHVKWLKPEKITGAKPASGAYTFAVR